MGTSDFARQWDRRGKRLLGTDTAPDSLMADGIATNICGVVPIGWLPGGTFTAFPRNGNDSPRPFCLARLFARPRCTHRVRPVRALSFRKSLRCGGHPNLGPAN